MIFISLIHVFKTGSSPSGGKRNNRKTGGNYKEK
jgi:hypothetical protein